MHHVVCDLLKHVLIGHDELLGGDAVGDVGQDAQSLLLHLGAVVALKDKYHSLNEEDIFVLSVFDLYSLSPF